MPLEHLDRFKEVAVLQAPGSADVYINDMETVADSREGPEVSERKQEVRGVVRI